MFPEVRERAVAAHRAMDLESGAQTGLMGYREIIILQDHIPPARALMGKFHLRMVFAELFRGLSATTPVAGTPILRRIQQARAVAVIHNANNHFPVRRIHREHSSHHLPAKIRFATKNRKAKIHSGLFARSPIILMIRVLKTDLT